MAEKTLIVVLGPTASGKTGLGTELAKRFRAPVISCDSRQIFREIPIGTAAPSEEEQGGVPHYFIASRSVTEDYNAGMYEAEAIALLDRLFETVDVVIMVGGSGLYIDAVCKGIDDLPATDHSLRERIQKRLGTEGLDALLADLERLDPEYYSKVDKHNPVRVTRALEVCMATGKPYSKLRRGGVVERGFRVVKTGISMERSELYDRINRRVDLMLEQGLEREAERVYPLRACNALNTVGYSEFFDFFDGKISRDEAVELIKRNSRRYAKRQITWFGRDKDIVWFPPDCVDRVEEYLWNNCYIRPPDL